MLESFADRSSGLNDDLGDLRRHLVSQINSLRKFLPVCSCELVPVHLFRINGSTIVVSVHALHETGNMGMGRIHFALHKVDEALFHDFGVSLVIVGFRPHVQGSDGELTLFVVGTAPLAPFALQSAHVVLACLGGLAAELHPDVEHLVAGINVVKTPADLHPGLVGVGTGGGQTLAGQLLGKCNLVALKLFVDVRGGHIHHLEFWLLVLCNSSGRSTSARAIIQASTPLFLRFLLQRRRSQVQLMTNGEELDQST